MLLALLVGGATAGEPGQLVGDIVIFRLGLQPLGDRALLVVGRRGDQRVGLVGRGNARRAIEDEGRADLGFVEQQFGLQQFELEADRPEILAQQEFRVLERELVGVALGLRGRRDMARGLGVDLRGGENALGRDCIVHMRPRLATFDYSVTPLPPGRASRPSRSAASRTSLRPAPRRAAANRSAARRPRG